MQKKNKNKQATIARILEAKLKEVKGGRTSKKPPCHVTGCRQFCTWYCKPKCTTECTA